MFTVWSDVAMAGLRRCLMAGSWTAQDVGAEVCRWRKKADSDSGMEMEELTSSASSAAFNIGRCDQYDKRSVFRDWSMGYKGA